MRTYFVFDLGETLLDFNKNDLWYQSLKQTALPVMYQNLLKEVSLFPTREISKEEYINLAYSSIVKQNPAEKEWRMDRRVAEYLYKLDLPVEPTIIRAQMDAYFSTIEPDVTIYSDTHAVLSQLNALGYRMALFSNTPWQLPGRYIEQLLKKFQLSSYFPVRYYSGDLEISKPNPKVLELIQKDAGVSKDEMIFLGDREKDIDVAANFGIPSIWINRSHASELKTINKPLFQVENLTNLLTKLPILM